MLDRLRAIAPYVVVLAIAAWLFHVALHFQLARAPGGLGPGHLAAGDPVADDRSSARCASCYGLRARRAGARDDGGLLQDVAAGIPQAVERPTQHPRRGTRCCCCIGIALTIAYVALLGMLGFRAGDVRLPGGDDGRRTISPAGRDRWPSRWPEASPSCSFS